MIALKTTQQHELITLRKKLYVKYMISQRCESIAVSVLNELGLHHRVSGGEIELFEDITQDHLNELKKDLKKSGMELLDVADSVLIDRIITSVNEVIHDSNRLPNITYEEIINKKVVLGSEFILKIFSEIKGVSILHYIILQKIEKAKELLLYSNHSLADIASLLQYKNEYYLTAQFKKFTGLSPDYFLEIKRKRQSNNGLH